MSTPHDSKTIDQQTYALVMKAAQDALDAAAKKSISEHLVDRIYAQFKSTGWEATYEREPLVRGWRRIVQTEDRCSYEDEILNEMLCDEIAHRASLDGLL